MLALTVPHAVAKSEGELAAEGVACEENVAGALSESAPEGVADRAAEAHSVAVEEMEKVAVVDGEPVRDGEPDAVWVTEELGVPLGVLWGVTDVLGHGEAVAV